MPELTVSLRRAGAAAPDPRPVQTVDEKGDYIFRFSLDAGVEPPPASQVEFYQQQLRDLLMIVRLYENGRPVLVDSFAFANDLQQQFPIPGLPPR
jgi:hypothetical protein